MYESIPSELKLVKNWVCWCGDKLPKNPYTGGNAQSNNQQTWGYFQDALDAIEKYKFDGVGFMFAPPYFGVDLDKCIDNTDFVDEFVEGLQSYNEISRSGKGIHIICKGKLPEGGRRKGNVEMYSEGRYFIMTGNMYNPNYKRIKDCTESIKVLHSKYIPNVKPAVMPREIFRLDMDDSTVIDKARSCKSGTLFQLLYSGQWQGVFNSQSEADLALCNQLAFWCQKDKAQMDRIFRSSGLYRDKWNRLTNGTTYGSITLDKAIDGCVKVYEPKVDVADEDLTVGMFEDDWKQSDGVIYEMNDSGNAKRFHDKFLGQVKYCYNRKLWIYWNGQRWCWDDEIGQSKRLADDICNDLKREADNCDDEDLAKVKKKWYNQTASHTRKEAMLSESQHLDGIPVSMSELDSYDMYLNTQNGIVSLRNGELVPHEPSFLMSKITTAECSTEYEEPKLWLSFLDDVTNGDKDLQRYLQKCVGYSLTGSTREQCAFFLYGMGNNGKSTFLDTIASVLGDYASNTQPDTIMIKKDNGINSDIARLKSARFVTCEEPTEGVRLNEGLVKQLTGGGKVTCRYLYGQEFEYEPEFKIWIATNHKPVIRGTDVGIWRRIRLIPFTVNIPAEKVDKNLKFKLVSEYPQILRWAVEGCMLWQKEGLEMPYVVWTATREYKQEMDLLQAFCEQYLVITNNPNDTINASDLYALYKNWARDNGEYEMTSRRFGTEITKKLPDKKRVGCGVVYTGVHRNDESYGIFEER